MYDSYTKIKGKIFELKRIMENKKTLVLGASPNPARYSYLAVNKLKKFNNSTHNTTLICPRLFRVFFCNHIVHIGNIEFKKKCFMTWDLAHIEFEKRSFGAWHCFFDHNNNTYRRRNLK